MAHTVQNHQFRVRDASCEVFRVFPFDELIVLAMHDHNRHADLSKIALGVIGLCLLHQGYGIEQSIGSE